MSRRAGPHGGGGWAGWPLENRYFSLLFFMKIGKMRSRDLQGLAGLAELAWLMGWLAPGKHLFFVNFLFQRVFTNMISENYKQNVWTLRDFTVFLQIN